MAPRGAFLRASSRSSAEGSAPAVATRRVGVSAVVSRSARASWGGSRLSRPRASTQKTETADMRRSGRKARQARTRSKGAVSRTTSAAKWRSQSGLRAQRAQREELAKSSLAASSGSLRRSSSWASCRSAAAHAGSGACWRRSAASSAAASRLAGRSSTHVTRPSRESQTAFGSQPNRRMRCLLRGTKRSTWSRCEGSGRRPATRNENHELPLLYAKAPSQNSDSHGDPFS
mmetsp:Transcript_17582/g.54961  ORF Transcript_17582/g.54961 Transcript_17582/m.54961 type:complete len:231 (-) Transcript_17582:623-1315(-)